MNRSKLDSIVKIVNGVVTSHGFECIEAEWVAGSKALRLFVEKVGGAIDLAGCVTVNGLLEECVALDQAVPGEYSLEVSSPGLERPLRSIEHFSGCIGKVVEVKLTDREQDRKHGKGKLLEVVGDLITLETSQGLWKFPHEKLQAAHLVYDWDRADA